MKLIRIDATEEEILEHYRDELKELLDKLHFVADGKNRDYFRYCFVLYKEARRMLEAEAMERFSLDISKEVPL